MAHKSPGSGISMNKESIGTLAELLKVCVNYLTDQAATVEKSVRYLTSEDNVSGADAEEYQRQLNIAYQMIVDSNTKFQKVQQATETISISLGNSAAKATANLADTESRMQSVLQKIREAGTAGN